MLGQENTYQLGRFFLSVIELLALIAIGIGVLTSVITLSTGEAGAAGGSFLNPAWLMTMLPGFGLTLVGFFIMAWTQVSRSRLDTAVMTRELLASMRKETPVE